MIARRVAIGGATNFAGKATALATWFLLTPFILDRLGPAAYGVWVLVGSIGAYGYLLDLGVAGAVVKYVAEFRARKEWDEAHAVVAAALRVYLVLGLVAVLLGAAAAILAPIMLNIPPADQASAAWAIFLTGLGIGVSLAFMPAPAVLRGLQRFDLYNLVVTTGTLLTAVATVAVLVAGAGLVGMVAVSIPVTVLIQLVTVALIRRVAPELDFGWRGAWRGQLPKITRFGGSSFALNASATLQTRTDEIVIATFLPVAAVTPYALARRLSEIALLLADQFIKVLLPLSSELHAIRDGDRLRAVYVMSTRLTLAFLVPSSLILVVFAGPILAAWVGPAYAASAPLVTILAGAALFRGLSWPVATLLQGMARHHSIAVLSIASGLTNVVLSIVLVQSLGVAGVAYGTLIPTAVEAMIVLPYGLRVVGVDLGAGLRQIVLPPLVPAVPMWLTLLVMREWLRPSGIDFLVPALVGAVIYAALYPLLGATRPEREMVRTVVLATLRRVQGASVR